MRKLFMTLIISAFLLGAQSSHAQGVGSSHLMTFEGTLVKYSPHPGYDCGVEYVHQVAKYHVDKVLVGEYAGDEIIVDHPACDENVFKHIPIGSHVKITVRVWNKYLVVTMYPGIREESKPNIFYVAEARPIKIKVRK